MAEGSDYDSDGAGSGGADSCGPARADPNYVPSARRVARSDAGGVTRLFLNKKLSLFIAITAAVALMVTRSDDGCDGEEFAGLPGALKLAKEGWGEEDYTDVEDGRVAGFAVILNTFVFYKAADVTLNNDDIEYIINAVLFVAHLTAENLSNKRKAEADQAKHQDKQRKRRSKRKDKNKHKARQPPQRAAASSPTNPLMTRRTRKRRATKRSPRPSAARCPPPWRTQARTRPRPPGRVIPTRRRSSRPKAISPALRRRVGRWKQLLSRVQLLQKMKGW